MCFSVVSEKPKPFNKRHFAFTLTHPQETYNTLLRVQKRKKYFRMKEKQMLILYVSTIHRFIANYRRKTLIFFTKIQHDRETTNVSSIPFDYVGQ